MEVYACGMCVIYAMQRPASRGPSIILAAAIDAPIDRRYMRIKIMARVQNTTHARAQVHTTIDDTLINIFIKTFGIEKTMSRNAKRCKMS